MSIFGTHKNTSVPTEVFPLAYNPAHDKYRALFNRDNGPLVGDWDIDYSYYDPTDYGADTDTLRVPGVPDGIPHEVPRRPAVLLRLRKELDLPRIRRALGRDRGDRILPYPRRVRVGEGQRP